MNLQGLALAARIKLQEYLADTQKKIDLNALEKSLKESNSPAAANIPTIKDKDKNKDGYIQSSEAGNLLETIVGFSQGKQDIPQASNTNGLTIPDQQSRQTADVFFKTLDANNLNTIEVNDALLQNISVKDDAVAATDSAMKQVLGDIYDSSKEYLQNNSQSLANLGIDHSFVKSLTQNSPIEFKEGIKKLKNLDDYLAKMQPIPPPEKRTAEILLGTPYKLLALSAIAQMLGAEKLSSTAADKVTRNKIIKALNTNGFNQGEKFLDDFLQANWLNKNNTNALKYIADPSQGGPGAINPAYDQKKLFDQAKKIMSPSPLSQAEGWLTMYGKNGAGGRSFAVEPNSLPNKENLPSFAVRWLVQLPGNIADLKSKIKDITGIDLTDSNTITSLNSKVPKIEEKLKAFDNLLEDKLKDLMAKALSSSIISISETANNNRNVSVKISKANLLSNLLQIDKKVIQESGVLNGDDETSTTMSINKTSWDQADSANKAMSGAFNVLDKLFNTKNNPNNKDAKDIEVPAYFKDSTTSS